MPPKFKFTRDEIVQAGLSITREGGLTALTARSLADALGSSSKPIFGLFESMEDVQLEVMKAANRLYHSFLNEDMAKNDYPPYKASGMAYIRFAREEKELFKLLFMRDRTRETVQEDREELRPLLQILMRNLHLSEDEAYTFHLELWIYVHGMASMIATSYLEWDASFISKALTDAYEGLKWRYTEKGR